MPRPLDVSEVDAKTRSLLVDAQRSNWDPGTYVDEIYSKRSAPRISELAWEIASGSVYAEQTGLDVASQLLKESDDTATKLILATAVGDEGKHTSAFHRFALLAGGSVNPPSAKSQELTDVLFGFADTTERFLAHTIMEGYAADEFIFFADAFQAESLGQLYSIVRRDESRHVAMGLHHLCRSTASSPPQISKLSPQQIDAVEQTCNELARPDAVAELVERLLPRRTSEEVETWITRRHSRRMSVLKQHARIGYLYGET